jgi:hypothetical protein
MTNLGGKDQSHTPRLTPNAWPPSNDTTIMVYVTSLLSSWRSVERSPVQRLELGPAGEYPLILAQYLRLLMAPIIHKTLALRVPLVFVVGALDTAFGFVTIFLPWI